MAQFMSITRAKRLLRDAKIRKQEATHTWEIEIDGKWIGLGRMDEAQQVQSFPEWQGSARSVLRYIRSNVHGALKTNDALFIIDSFTDG